MADSISIDQARRLVSASRYLTLATADGDGRPWATPVWFAADDLESFCWVSKPGARHSVNIAGRREVFLVIFDSTVDPGAAAAVYVEADAVEVAEEDRTQVLAVYNERSVAQGLPEWTEAKVSGDARHRLFRARVRALYTLDEHDERIPLITRG